MDTPHGRQTLGVRQLRNEVAAALRRAGAGERIVITADGVPIAELGPITPTGAPTLADLVATGQVNGSQRDRPPTPDPVPRPADVRLDDLLDELRGA